MMERISNFYFRELIPLWISALDTDQGFFGKIEYWIGIHSFFIWLGANKIHIQDANYKDVIQWKTDLMTRGVAPLSIDTYARGLNYFCIWLEKQGYVKENPMNKGFEFKITNEYI
jgi:site-specific recombinase XerD